MSVVHTRWNTVCSDGKFTKRKDFSTLSIHNNNKQIHLRKDVGNPLQRWKATGAIKIILYKRFKKNTHFSRAALFLGNDPKGRFIGEQCRRQRSLAFGLLDKKTRLLKARYVQRFFKGILPCGWKKCLKHKPSKGCKHVVCIHAVKGSKETQGWLSKSQTVSSTNHKYRTTRLTTSILATFDKVWTTSVVLLPCCFRKHTFCFGPVFGTHHGAEGSRGWRRGFLYTIWHCGLITSEPHWCMETYFVC